MMVFLLVSLENHKTAVPSKRRLPKRRTSQNKHALFTSTWSVRCRHVSFRYSKDKDGDLGKSNFGNAARAPLCL